MESTRRPLDRSLTRESGLKKPRLAEDIAPSNGRARFIQRPAAANSGGGSRVQRDLDSESSDSVRGPYQNQTGQQLHQELVNQYKTALAELTFNSKPIITNLTIIAGENLHAAKAIAATVCANILEVPREQKLPSLYLLDSIVKNIGKDYIKYFGSRLPEVFCKAYRQVDPSTHPGMCHLFGTWKGVFPPQALQIIESELGFATSANGSSSGATTSRPDPQTQCPAHSIHVNPKYLEARQRLQTPKPIQHHGRDQVNEPGRGRKSSITPYVDSIEPGQSGLGTGRVSEKFKDQGFDRPWYESGMDICGKMSNHKNGFEMKYGSESYADPRPENSDLDVQLKQNVSVRNASDMNRSWKNTEEEEYTWDAMNSRMANRTAIYTSAKNHWISDNYEGLDLDSYPRRPQNMHETGSRLENEASVDSMSAELGQVASGTRVPLSWSKDLFLQERRFSQSGNNISGYSEEYSTVSRSSANSLARAPLKSPVGSNQIGTPSSKYSANVVPGLKASTIRQQHPRGAPVSSARSPIYHPTELQNNFSECSPSSVRPPGLKSRRAQDELSQDSLPLPSRDLYDATQRFQPPSLLASSAPTPRLQQRKQVSSSQQRKPEVLEFEFSEGQKLLPLQSSMAESQSTPGHSSFDHSNPLTIDSPGLSITSSLLSDVTKSGIFGSSASATKSDLRVGTELSQVQPSLSNDPPADISSSSSPVHGNMFLPGSSQKKLKQPPLPAGPPSSVADIGSGKKQIAANSASNPVFSLLSSLVAKGLISISKSDSQLSTPTEKPEQPLDRGSGVARTSLTPFSSVPITVTPPASSSADDLSSLRPITHSTDDFAESTTKIKNLIGFEFKPNVIRNLNPDVITELVSELPRRCSICGLRLKLQEHLDRHMEWHSLRHPDQNPSSSASRKWYVNSTDWVAGNCEPLPDTLSDMEESIETLESKEQMVLADESQCACILCGELFEDFYSVERKEWMFKGAIYSTVPLSESLEKIGTTTDTASLGPIVHANCISEVPVHEFGRVNDVKSEEGA